MAVGSSGSADAKQPQLREPVATQAAVTAPGQVPRPGMEVIGWPVMVLRRGEVVMRHGTVQAEPGTGQFLPRAPYDMIRPAGCVPDGFDASAFLV